MRRNLIVLPVISVLLMLLLLTACGDSAATTAPATTGSAATAPTKVAGTAGSLNGEIKIGMVESMTGPNSTYGISIKNGAELAFGEINDSKFLGNATIRDIVLDDKADKQEGISVMTKLLEDEKVVAVLGPTLSSTAFATDPIAQKKGVPVMGTSNTAAGITEMGNFVFRNSIPETTAIPGAIATIKSKVNPQKAAILYEVTNEFTKSSYQTFEAELKKNGIAISGVETYNKGDTDFRTQLNKLKAGSPDLLVVSALIGEGIAIVQQAREVGITKPIVGGNGLNSPNLITQAKDAAEGVIVGSAWSLENSTPKSDAFKAAYKKKYNIDPDQYAAQAYDGAYLFATAIKNAGSAEPKAIRDALAAIRDYDGVLGKFSFDENRNPIHPSITLVVKNGKYTLYK